MPFFVNYYAFILHLIRQKLFTADKTSLPQLSHSQLLTIDEKSFSLPSTSTINNDSFYKRTAIIPTHNRYNSFLLVNTHHNYLP